MNTVTGLLLYVFCEFASFGNVGLIRFMRVLKTSFTHVARGVHLEPPRVAVQCASLRLWMQAVRLRDVRGVAWSVSGSGEGREGQHSVHRLAHLRKCL